MKILHGVLATKTVVLLVAFVAVIAIGIVMFILPRGFPNVFSSMVTVVGVYPVSGSQNTYLLEVIVKAPASTFDLEFFQEESSLFTHNRHLAYNQCYLNSDGTEMASRETENPTTRLLFFMDSVNIERPLFTPFGPVTLPDPIPLPERLENIIISSEASPQTDER